MRYENLNHFEKLKLLHDIYDVINEFIMCKALTPAHIDICNLKSELYAVFRVQQIPQLPHENILISHTLEEDLTLAENEKIQIEFLAQVLLHEMVHQYCYEKNIDDRDHNKNYVKVAKGFGLEINNDGDEILSEKVKFLLSIFFDQSEV